ncbi:hypothetical protein H9P43_008807 [Blastocladiella emersonii ATCC 22665]|nr:hypothetical protein H9P43_008807 [Blastocladiella emersonii ATCC 22665]
MCLAARVVAGLKHAPGCTCESEFEVIQYDWNLKYKLGIKDIEAFGKEVTKALQTIRKPFKEKTEWFDLVQAAADNSCIITNKVGEKKSLTKQ